MSSTSVVQLNIGGTHFQTSRTTLTKYDGFFKTLLETEYPVAKDEPIFVDRSPKHFEKILNFMRDGTVVLPNCSEEVREIQNEAQYYLLMGLVELCKMERNQTIEIRHLKNWEDETIAISNSPKKAVLIVRTDRNCCLSAAIVFQIAFQYREILDVFFSATRTATVSLFYDKTEKQFVSFSDSQHFEHKLRTRLEHLL